jgi:hypothetical protein
MAHVFLSQADPPCDTLHTGWHLARVVLLNPGTGRSHTFNYNAWLFGPDNLSVRLEDATGGTVSSMCLVQL